MTDPVSGIAAATPLTSFMAGTAQPAVAAVPDQSQPAAASAPASPAPYGQVPASLQAVAQALTQAFQPTQTDLRFQVDKVTGQMVISVIDAHDGKTLLQIPGEEALAIAQSLEQLQAHLIQRQA
jgi:flagellar protein FlaG